MWNSRDALREQGVLLPAAHPNEFFLAANDVQGGRFVLVDLPEAEGAWARVAARAGSWPGRVLITCELLGFSEPDHVQRIVSSLAPATLHLVVMRAAARPCFPPVTAPDAVNEPPVESRRAGLGYASVPLARTASAM